jgi:pimeloyl-ACP methyl ester carboxylesterase
MRFATNFDGCNLSYSVTGEGQKILLIQGVGLHGDGWSPQTDFLKDRFCCLVPDNRGIGRSLPMGNQLTVSQMVRDLAAVLDHAHCESVHLVGHSLGGLLAQAFALEIPDRVKSLALLCTFANGRKVAPLTMRMMWQGMRATVGTRLMRRKGFLGLLYPPNSVELCNPNMTAANLETIFGHDLGDQPAVVKHQLRAMRQVDLTDQIERLSGLPTLIMSGSHDLIAPPKLGRTMAEKIAGSRFVEVADAAHGLPITHRDLVNKALHDHVSQAS